MNGLTLKLIAMVTMFIDHFTAVLIPENTLAYLIGRSIGRFAFPIFCFLIVEGLYHTKDIRKYLLRLGAFALISEIPFNLAFCKNNPGSHQNVFFTLFIGLGVIYLMRAIDSSPKLLSRLPGTILKLLVIFAGCYVAELLHTDYSAMGVLLITVFYVFRTQKAILILMVFLLNAMTFGGMQALATISMIFIWFYNGKRGPKINKYIFYAFYPVHILILYLISTVNLY